MARYALLLAAVLVVLPQPAPAADGPDVRAEMLADTLAIAPGEPFTLAVRFHLPEGWHIYWKHPGDAGLATAIDWKLPEGFRAGPLRWPAPKTFTQPGDIAGYGYEKQVILAAEVTPPKDLKPGAELAFAAHASWLACKDNCVPGKQDVALTLPAAKKTTPANEKLFVEWRKELPTMAPTFTLQTHDGKEVSLADLRGKVVVLEWFNPDCPFVKRHHAKRSTMKDLAGKYAPKGVVWLAVNSTHYMDAAASAKWRAEWKLPYPVLVDQNGAVGRKYKAKTTPHMFVINQIGEIVYEGAIDSDPRGGSKDPTNHVDAALADLLAGRPVGTPQTKPYGCSVKYAQN